MLHHTECGDVYKEITVVGGKRVSSDGSFVYSVMNLIVCELK